MRITVIGTGYLGAVHAACMAELGHDVLGVDVDQRKVAALAEGRAPFYEPGLGELIDRNVRAGRLGFSSCLQDAAAFGEAHFICVGTPQCAGSSAADMTFVDAAVTGLARYLTEPCLVVGKSTVPVGTAQRLARLIASVAPVGLGAELAWNPEFLREGFAVGDTLHPERVVVGMQSAHGEAVLRRIYEKVITGGTPFLATDLATAELVKVSANAFLAMKISFINAMAEVCEGTGADVVTLGAALGLDSRIGGRFLRAGLGFGGGCLAKAIRAFRARAEQLGMGEALSFLQQVDEVNTRCRKRTIDIARALTGGSLEGKRIGVLGAAFKPDSDDVRDSPALDVAAVLQLEGAEVRVHDPEAIENARTAVPSLDYTAEVSKAVEGSDLVLHLTEWQQYRDLDPQSLAHLAREPRVLDARNVLDVDLWRRGGWAVRALGRPLR